MHGTIEELLKVVFCMQPVPRLYIEATSQVIVSRSVSGQLRISCEKVARQLGYDHGSREHCWNPLPSNNW
jgi:hypothetical protein